MEPAFWLRSARPTRNAPFLPNLSGRVRRARSSFLHKALLAPHGASSEALALRRSRPRGLEAQSQGDARYSRGQRTHSGPLHGSPLCSTGIHQHKDLKPNPGSLSKPLRLSMISTPAPCLAVLVRPNHLASLPPVRSLAERHEMGPPEENGGPPKASH